MVVSRINHAQTSYIVRCQVTFIARPESRPLTVNIDKGRYSHVAYQTIVANDRRHMPSRIGLSYVRVSTMY